MTDPPVRRKPRLRGVFHELGFYAAVGLGLPLALTAEPGRARLAAIVFASCVAGCFGASALYHRPTWSPHVRQRLARVDHAGVYLLIAGTYTPFTLITLEGPWGWSLFAIVWTIALVGMYLVTRRSERRAPVIALYVGLGWIGLVAIGPLVRNLPPGGLWLLFGGGVCYTLGVPFYLSRRIPFNHALWHLFVLGGSVLQFFAVLLYVLPHAPE